MESAGKCNLPASFSKEEEMVLLEEFMQFVEKRGENVRNKWVEFLETSSLKGKYNPRQISKKMSNLEKKFGKHSASAPPPSHTDEARLFDLSQSLWGKRKTKRPRVVDDDDGNNEEVDMIKPPPPTLSLKQTHQEGEEEEEDDDDDDDDETWRELDYEELELFSRKLNIEMLECQLRLTRLKRRTQSSEKCEAGKEGLRQSPVEDPIALHYNMNDNNCDQESDRSAKSKDGKQLRLKNVEPPSADVGVSNDTVGEFGNEAVVGLHSIDHPQFCGGEEKDADADDSHESNVIRLTSGVIIEEVVVGDPNKRPATKGKMIKVHMKGNVKGSDRFFESTHDQDRPLMLCLGSDEMIDGFTQGVEGMRVGGKKKLIIPPPLGYGTEGLGENIPPDSWLEYEVELLGVRR